MALRQCRVRRIKLSSPLALTIVSDNCEKSELMVGCSSDVGDL